MSRSILRTIVPSVRVLNLFGPCACVCVCVRVCVCVSVDSSVDAFRGVAVRKQFVTLAVLGGVWNLQPWLDHLTPSP